MSTRSDSKAVTLARLANGGLLSKCGDTWQVQRGINLVSANERQRWHAV
jgi:hypothetical protein